MFFQTDFILAIGLALLGGIVPAIIWLKFWLQEDKAHPEPNHLIIKTFLLGMLAVPIAILLQFLISEVLFDHIEIESSFVSLFPLGVLVMLLLLGTEEIVKYWAAYKGGLSTRDNDEPMDAVVYMITAALGFAALENVLFIISPLLAGDSTVAFITGNMRFVGATLLHVASSAIVGMFLTFSFEIKNKIKKRFLIPGLVLATLLHTLFNYFIMKSEKFVMIGFSLVWISVILLIILFEKVKRIELKRKKI